MSRYKLPSSLRFDDDVAKLIQSQLSEANKFTLEEQFITGIGRHVVNTFYWNDTFSGKYYFLVDRATRRKILSIVLRGPF
jgi:hypothetical protein